MILVKLISWNWSWNWRPARGAMLLLATLLLTCSAYGQKTDKVYFLNGDYILGEMTSLEHGKLKIDSKYTGKVSSDWKEVISVTTDKHYIIQTEDGLLYEGTIGFTDPDSFTVVARDTLFRTVRSDIVRLIPYDNRIWQRFEGGLGVGFDYSTGSDVLQINLFSNLTYVGPNYRSTISFDNLFTNILTDTTKYTKRDLTLSSMYLIRKSWFIAGEYKFEQNSEQGFDARNTLTASGGKNLLQSQKTDMMVMLGFNYNRETYTSSETGKEISNNVEMPMAVQFQAFKYDDPELTTTLAFTYFPSLTDGGRHRFKSSIKFGLEFFNDFWFSVEFYDDYDNRVPSTGMKSNDYGVVSTLSYSFD